MAISGGEDWNSFFNPLVAAWKPLGWVFYGYMCVMVFCVLNVITSIFLQAADDVAETNPHIWKDALKRAKKKEENHQRILDKMFTDADKGENGEKGDGRLTETELLGFLENKQSADEFDALQLDSKAAKKIFNLICDTSGFEGGEGSVDKETFSSKINAVRGDAKALDVALLQKQTLALHQQMVHEFKQLRKVHEHGKRNPMDSSPLSPERADELA